MLKAVREAREHTDWLSLDTKYEAAVAGFIFTGEMMRAIAGRVPLASAFASFPVAVLLGTDAGAP